MSAPSVKSLQTTATASMSATPAAAAKLYSRVAEMSAVLLRHVFTGDAAQNAAPGALLLCGAGSPNFDLNILGGGAPHNGCPSTSQVRFLQNHMAAVAAGAVSVNEPN